jgi:hypothetical protein
LSPRLLALAASLSLSAWPLAAIAQEPARNLGVQTAPKPVAASLEKRVALVIGNNAYKDAPLTNPVNDAKAMAEALQRAGFTVMLRTDISHREFLVSLREFGDTLRRAGNQGVGLFYFAGHGMQIKGRNYLIPAGATIEREDEVAYAGVDAQAVLDKMEAAGNATNLMILDACRNNPFARSFRSSSAGLAQMEAPVGAMVAFATAPGSVASDGQGSNGLYTQHLLQALRKPGMKVEDVFKQTRAAVRRDSQGKQIPWESTSLEGDFYFLAPPPPAPVAPPPPPAAPPPVDTAKAVEDAYWASVKDSQEPGELRAFLKRYPQSPHASQVGARLAALAATTAVAQVTPPVPSPVTAPVSTPVPVPAAPRPQPAAVVASPPPAAPAVAAASQPARQRPVDVGRSNAQGYTVGDKWNYQVVDKYRGEVVRNYGLQVGRMEGDGSWFSGKSLYDAAGRLVRFTTGSGDQREFSPYAPRWWPGMKVGERREFEYEFRAINQNGNHWTNRVSTEMKVVGREIVRVPAGEFNALRLEMTGKVTPVGRPGYGVIKMVCWYVPELHTYVAYDEDTIWNGRPDDRFREELTSLNLVNQRDLALAAPKAGQGSGTSGKP